MLRLAKEKWQPVLFYEEPSVVKTFSAEPSVGTLSVDRLVDGHSECFEAVKESPHRLKKKSVVFSPLISDIATARQRYDNPCLEIDSLGLRSLPSHKQITEAAWAKRHVPFDQLCIVDYLSDLVRQGQVFSSKNFNFSALDDEAFNYLLEEELPHSYFALERVRLFLEDLNETVFERLRRLKNKFQHVSIEFAVDSVDALDFEKIRFYPFDQLGVDTSTPEKIYDLLGLLRFSGPTLAEEDKKLLRGATKLKALILPPECRVGDLDLGSVSFDLLESVELWSDESGTVLGELLQHAKNVKSLNYRYWGRPQLGYISLNQLESVDIRGGIPGEVFTDLLRRAKNVKSLNFCSVMGGLKLDDVSLDQLEFIKVWDDNISVDNLSSLLKCAKNVKSLDCGFIGELKLEGVFFDRLESISISMTTMRDAGEVLADLLRRAKNVKSLFFSPRSGFTLNIVKLNLDDVSLDQLESIAIGGSISSGALKELLKHARNLKSLKLFSVSADLNLDDVSLDQLESIAIDGIISSGALKELLKHARNLKSLKLSSVSAGLNLDNVSLDQLESITIDGHISSGTLKELLQHARSLKSLTLPRMLGNPNVDNISFAALNSLEVREDGVFVNILRDACDLNSLILRGVYLCEWNVQGAQLGSLRRLEITQANISSKALQDLLGRTVYLNQLTLTHLSADAVLNLQMTALPIIDSLTVDLEKHTGGISSAERITLLSQAKKANLISVPCSALSGVVAKRLESLTMKCGVIDVGVMGSFLSNAISLISLKIESGDNDAWCGESVNLGGVQFEQLRSLTIVGPGSEIPNGLQALLQRMPNLRELTFKDTDLTGIFFEYLSFRSLYVLRIEHCYVEDQSLKQNFQRKYPGCRVIFSKIRHRYEPLPSEAPQPFGVSSAMGTHQRDASPSSSGAGRSSSSAASSSSSGSLGWEGSHYQPKHMIDSHTQDLADGGASLPPPTRIFRDLRTGFYDPPPNYYRLAILDQLDPSSGEISASPLLREELTQCDISKLTSMGATHEASIQLQLSATGYTALPSLFPHEEITHLIAMQNGVPAPVELFYSAQRNLYYVKLKEGQSPGVVSVQFKLAKPSHCNFDELSKEERAQLDADLHGLIQYCRSFKPGEMKNEAFKKLPPLERMYREKKGVCRHRAAVFKYMLEKNKYPYEARIIYSEVHAFVEVRKKGETSWLSICLGGAPPRLSFNPNPQEGASSVSKPPPLISSTEAEVVPKPRQLIEESSAKAAEKKPKQGELGTVAAKHPEPAKVSRRAERAIVKRGEFSIPIFCGSLIDPLKKRQLLVCDSSESLALTRLVLQQHLENAQAASTYLVDAKEELSCRRGMLLLTKESMQGQYHAPSEHRSALNAFIQKASQHSGTTYYLFIDWTSFPPKELVAHNSVIDRDRKIDDIPLPDNVIVVGFMPRQGAYEGADFSSRFDSRKEVDLDADQKAVLQAKVKPYQLETRRQEVGSLQRIYMIDLYESPDWKNLLIGRWEIHGQSFSFIKGPLWRAIDEGYQSIVLRNPPKQDREFNDFFESFLLRGTFDCHGVTVKKPEGFSVTTQEDYPWREWIGPAQFFRMKKGEVISRDPPFFCLNQKTFQQLFVQYRVVDGALQMAPGYLMAIPSGELRCFVTHDLGKNQWGQLLQATKVLGMKLTVILAPDISVPFDGVSIQEQSYPAVLARESCPIQLIESNAPDDEAREPCYQAATIITASELKLSDLFIAMTPRFNEQGQLDCQERLSDVIRRLRAGQQVVLKGNIHQDLAEYLASVILYNQGASRVDWFDHGGHLTIISDDLSAFHYAQSLITKQEKQVVQKTPRIVFEPDKIPADSPDAFIANRKKVFCDAFKDHQLVFLQGESATGKTTFMQRTYPNCCMGEKNILRWALTRLKNPQHLVILFLDEANLNPSDWTAFQDLLKRPPSIYLNGVYYALSPQHRVVFAGNAQSYGGGRKQPEILEHMPVIQFEPIPASFIKEKVLRPILPQNVPEDILTLLCDIYAISVAHQDELVRELETAAKLISLMPTDNNKALQIIYYMFMNCIRLKKEERSRIAQLFAVMPFAPAVAGAIAPSERSASFVIPSSHQPLKGLLCAMLRMRMHPSQSGGGLGGIIFEGPPGIGKSEFVRAVLKQEGLARDQDYVELNMSLSREQREAVLLDAFHTGKIVFIDETNAGILEGELINALLMGKTPEGDLPRQPGFMIVGTQNPPCMAGRSVLSPALQHRLSLQQYPEYTEADLREIYLTTHSDMKSEEVARIAHQFFEGQKEAIRSGKTPQTIREWLGLPVSTVSSQEALPSSAAVVMRTLGMDGIAAVSSKTLSEKPSSKEAVTLVAQKKSDGAVKKSPVNARSFKRKAFWGSLIGAGCILLLSSLVAVVALPVAAVAIIPFAGLIVGTIVASVGIAGFSASAGNDKKKSMVQKPQIPLEVDQAPDKEKIEAAKGITTTSLSSPLSLVPSDPGREEVPTPRPG